MNAYTSYIFPVVILAYFFWRWISARRVRRQLPELLRLGARIVDVRSAEEFSSGHAPGSENIPLPLLATRAGELDPSKPIILCCASGTRSGMATRILKRQGFVQVLNGGTWRNVSLKS